MNKLCIIFTLFTLLSCSTIEFKQDEDQKFTIGVTPELARVETVDGVCEGFFWGALTDNCSVDLYDQYKNRNLYGSSYVKVSQTFTLSNVILSMMTFGIYMPVSYNISVYSK